MAHRKFKDRQGRGWQARVESKRRWWLEPLPGNEEARRLATPPTYADDPFELSEQELQRVLKGARPSRGAPGPPPFKDLD